MSNSEEKLNETLSRALASKNAERGPGFDEAWLAAEARYLVSKRRYRRFIGIAAAIVVVAIVLGMLPPRQAAELPDFELVAEFMNSTQWKAPSDVLMPEYSIDVYGDYGEFQQPPASTKLYEGSLL